MLVELNMTINTLKIVTISVIKNKKLLRYKHFRRVSFFTLIVLKSANPREEMKRENFKEGELYEILLKDLKN